MIADNYGIIMDFYHPFIEYRIFGNNRRHSMLVFLKENIAFRYNDHQEDISKKLC